MRRIRKLFSEATAFVFRFLENDPFIYAAALSFYAMLSLAPLLLVAIAVAGFVFGEEAAQGELDSRIRTFTGESGAQVIQTILAQASGPEKGVTATVVGIVMLLIGASTVFAQLQAALNKIWRVPVEQQGSAVKGFVRNRLVALAVVFMVGGVLLALILASSALGVARQYLGQSMFGAGWFWSLVDFTLTLLILSLLMSLLFKMLPQTPVKWSRVWVGAIVTAVMFGLGKFAIGFYLSVAGIGSAYGAAGSLVALLVWIYYSAIIFLFGAEIAHWHAEMRKQRAAARS